MNLCGDMRIFCTVVILVLCLKESVAIFFNKTSHIELKPFNISKGFALTFKTCNGGTLLQQDGAGTDYFELYVVPGFMNYTSLHFTPSTLVLKWRTASKIDSVHVGNELDQSKPYDVSFLPGIKNVRNTTLSVSIGTSKLSTVRVADSILDIVSHGNMTLGSGFIGCINFGSSFNIQMDSLKNVSISEKCPLNVDNVITSCEKKKCPVGFKGYYCEENIDDCASLPCHHASKCIDEVANYTCECGAGWSGRNCDKLKDKKLCDYKPCKNGGICLHASDFNNYTCSCKALYSGRNCSIKIMGPCESNPCFNNGTCRNITEVYYECDCHPGFGGKTCQVNIDDCASAECGKGTCIDGISSHSCNCSGTGYNGTKCENDIDECDSMPCNHNGTCSNYGGGYTCNCNVGYSGKNCENNIDDCALRPCKNGGNCTDSLNDFSCHCPPGFSGKLCESKLHPCNVDKNCSACYSCPCQHGKCNCTCSLYAMHYNCTCDRGYRGMNCSEDINECAENGILCYNNGSCENQEGGFRCKCQKDYTGKYCNETKSICHPNPCENGKCSNFTAVNYNCSCFDGWQGRNCTEDVDECFLKTDRCNRTTSTCKNTSGSYICECKPGYEGEYCNDDIDECKPLNPCLHSGICRNSAGSYICYCHGYKGENCSEKINDCLTGDGTQKCKNAICKDSVEAYECVCYAGWKGRHCDEDINECDLGFCRNNALCNNTLGNYTCTCQPGYADFNCSTDIDECSSDPCQNNGVCEDKVNGFACNCSLGYEGQLCEFDIDWCNETRYNGSLKLCTYGNCSDHLLNYTCDCFVGFVGRNCDIDVDECEVKPCQNGATCVQKSNVTAIETHFGRNKTYPPYERGGYLCICMPGYNGTDCENDIDECQLHKPCNSTGTKMCNDSINDYNCTCKPGFTGRNCSTDIDECASNPCQNNGTCFDLPAMFSCNCTANFTGYHCERRVDPCTALQPCRNGGTCTPQDHNFTCACAAGFAGDTCIDETTLGFDGTTSMTLTLGEASALNVSLSFRTIFADGVLLSESAKWTLALTSGKLEVTWLKEVLFVLGSGGAFSDSRWHSVSLVVNEVSISANVGGATCVQRCSNKTDIPPTLAAALSSGTQLVVGGTPGTSARSGFIGSIRDLAVNDVTYYPGVSGVNASNVITGFQRRNVCSSEPCVHGACKDLWTTYECVCDRNWTGRNCTEVVRWGTFGKQSYAKYSGSTSFKTLAFSMRTRSSSSVVVLLYLNATAYLSVETSNGVLQLKNKGGVIGLGNTNAMKVDNASVHHISISRSAIQIDNASYDVTVPPLAIQDVFVGGVQEGYLDEISNASSYRGCVGDVRLNGKQLLFFNQTAGEWNRTQKNVAPDCLGEDVCGNVSGNKTCLNKGNCTDLWNLYRCDCPWPYGGNNCELYGCEWTNPCPRNATCVNLKRTSEYECIEEVTLNGSQSIASFTNSTPLSNVQSLVAQFRTRQNTSSILVSSEDSSFFEITIQDGRLLVSYNLKENLTETIKTNVFVSDGRWHEVKLQSNANETNIYISTMELLGSQTKYSMNTTLVRNSSVLNRAFSNLVSTAGVHLGSPSNKTTGVHLIGCLREIRIGNQLLPLAVAANLTTDDTKSGFTRAESAFSVRHLENVTNGCQGNPVCTGSVCGAGDCVDEWNDFSCACPNGYGGRLCERNPCSPSPCNNGSCSVNTNGAFKCACPPDYGGPACDDPCAKSRCENGGTCQKTASGFVCNCESGWSGEFCTTAAASGDDEDDRAMIIGLSVAGGCLLLIIIIAICLCTRQTSSTFGTYSPSGEEKFGGGVRVEMSPVLNVPPPEKLI